MITKVLFDKAPLAINGKWSNLDQSGNNLLSIPNSALAKDSEYLYSLYHAKAQSLSVPTNTAIAK